MIKQIIISVIMPVYNGEAFVRRAVDSVLGQMDGRIELILVNDGSTDASGAICDEYADRHSDIHVIHKPNGGTSSAKNMGIAIAKGQYLSFIDCDDYFDEDTFAQIIPILQEYQPDCLDFGWKYINTGGGMSRNHHQCKKNTLMSLQELETVILPPLLNLRKDDAHFIFDFCCNKIFRAEIIKTFHVRFDEEKRTWEDRTFLLRHLKHCQSYYSMDQCFYNYVYTPASLSQRYSLDFFDIILANNGHYRELFEDRFDFDTQYNNDYWARVIENMILRSLEQRENQKIIRYNIYTTLQNEQVCTWYTKRTCSTVFQRKISKLLSRGKYRDVLRCYEKQVVQKQCRNAIAHIINCVKYGCQKLWGR